MFDPIPEPNAPSDYLKIREGDKHRIRIMGTTKDPATFIQGWEAWGDDDKPHRIPYEQGQSCPESLKKICRKGEKTKLFWYFTVWHVDNERPMVYEVTQSTIKTAILAYANNPAWGVPCNYVLEIGRTGTGKDTVYTVIAEPPVEPPAKIILDEMKDAMIDLRVILMDKDDPKANDGNPFGALNMMPATIKRDTPSTNGQPRDTQGATNDQVNIKELREAGEPIPMPKDKQPEESLSSVGSITRDAIETLKAAHDKAAGAAPEMKDGMPY
jgi:hypothetical protein